MNDNHVQHAKEILESIKYATIATTSPDGQPWNSPVAYVVDADLNIYWFSDKEKLHSQNIRANGKVFIVIYNSTLPNDDAEGIYIKAEACEVDDSEVIKLARKLMGASTESIDKFLGNASLRCYKAMPQEIWVNDAEKLDGDSWRDFRVGIPVDELSSLMRL